MCHQPLETELPSRVNSPFVVVRFLFIIKVFLQKFTTTCLVQLKIEAYVTTSPEDIRPSLDHGQRKVSEFLHNSEHIDLLDNDNECTFTIVVAGASASLVCYTNEAE